MNELQKTLDYMEYLCSTRNKGNLTYSYPDIRTAVSALKELRQYRSIGTLDECRVAREKRKVAECERIGCTQLKCICGAIIRLHKYCPYCGQAIGWTTEHNEID